LKYALPLTGGQGIGNAPPASNLAKRDTDFTLGNLQRGSSGAPWVIDWQKHYDLSRQYREAANRELRLGRFRRAAYICAELLKDFREAANVLRPGKHFREASVLYLKHLGDPLEGARSLRDGGFLLEAIAIYENRNQYETVAELYAQLGNEPENERFYRLAVSRCVAHGHTIKAAILLERHLLSPDEAIVLLQKTWPSSLSDLSAARSGSCLATEAYFFRPGHRRSSSGPAVGRCCR
jgi:tetratricopeptide (TPR) repeat protein